MAIVADLAGIGTLDYSYADKNRTNAGDPNGTLTPLFAGEIILDTTNKKLWQTQSKTANNQWVEFFVGTYVGT